MDKREIAAFFDRLAPSWDGTLERSDEIIGRILDNAGVAAGKDVLDVACGTGVLIPDYLARGVRSVTGVDISPEMTGIARRKFPHENVRILCGDMETLRLDARFDCIVVYNAFPHFPEPRRLLENLAAQLRPGGTLTVAHGMSRAALNAHHAGSAAKVSAGLPHEDALEALFPPALRVTVKISDTRMYQVTGLLETA